MLEGLNTKNVDDLSVRAAQVRQAIVATPLPGHPAGCDSRGLCPRWPKAAEAMRPWRSAAAPPPRICPMPASPDSRKPISTCRADGAARRLPALLRLAVHRPGDLLSRRQGLRSFQGRPVGRRAAHGPLRSGQLRNHVHDRYRNRLSRRRADRVLIRPGRNVVQGSVNPDEFVVFKPTLKEGFRPILQKTLGTKEFKLVLDVWRQQDGQERPGVRRATGSRFALSDDDILKLARWGCLIEDHYSRKHGRFCRWISNGPRTGRRGELFIVQARPETVQARKDRDVLETYRLARSRQGAGHGPQRGREDRPGAGARDSNVHASRLVSRRAKCW